MVAAAVLMQTGLIWALMMSQIRVQTQVANSEKTKKENFTLSAITMGAS